MQSEKKYFVDIYDYENDHKQLLKQEMTLSELSKWICNEDMKNVFGYGLINFFCLLDNEKKKEKNEHYKSNSVCI